MRFDMKLNEVQYIQKQFHFGSLLGVEKNFFPLLGVDKTLKNKGAIVEREGRPDELSNAYRYLFSAWEKMRYSVVRLDEDTKDDFFCALANEKEFILVDQVGKDMVVEIADFQSEVFDTILFNMAEFEPSLTAEQSFIIPLPADDFVQLSSSRKGSHIELWSRKLGLREEDLSYYLDAINKNDGFIFLCEDHLEEIGSLIKIVKTPKGYYALKHVTPKDSAEEKMVMVVGDAQMIINSVYIF